MNSRDVTKLDINQLEQLEELDLSSNNISVIPTEYFVKRVNLKKLNISHNNLTV